MRIIIIIIGASASLSTAALVLGGFFFLMFSMDGDLELNTINTVVGNTSCVPDIETYSYVQSVAEKHRRNEIPQMSEDEIEKFLLDLGITQVQDGAKVKILDNGVGYYPHGQLQKIFHSVSLIEDQDKICLMPSDALEMTFSDWIKWKMFD